jgi:hypothetical protein
VFSGQNSSKMTSHANFYPFNPHYRKQAQNFHTLNPQENLETDLVSAFIPPLQSHDKPKSDAHLIKQNFDHLPVEFALKFQISPLTQKFHQKHPLPVEKIMLISKFRICSRSFHFS